MSKIIKGPWKPKDYDPSKDPEFHLPSETPKWVLNLIVVSIVLLSLLLLFTLIGK